MLLQSTATEGILEKEHAIMVNKALRLDALDARDIMVHRLDIKWLDTSLTAQEALSKVSQFGHTRVPVCRGDVDDLVGDFVVQAQQPQRGTTLARRAKGGLHNGVGYVLWQRGRIDQHGVDAASLGYQRHYRPVLARQTALNDFCDLS